MRASLWHPDSMLVAARAVVLAMLAVLAVGVAPAEAQLWKPAPKKPAATAPTKPTRVKPVKPKRVRPAARPSRPAPRRTVVRADPPRERARADAADGLPEFDDTPVIVVELPTRSER